MFRGMLQLKATQQILASGQICVLGKCAIESHKTFKEHVQVSSPGFPNSVPLSALHCSVPSNKSTAFHSNVMWKKNVWGNVFFIFLFVETVKISIFFDEYKVR